MSPSVLAQVRRQPGVLSAAGSVFDVGTVLGKNGKRIGKGGSPNFIASIAELPRFNAFTIKEGRKPQTADEVAIDASTANKQHFKLGDKISVVATAPRKDYTIVGIDPDRRRRLLRRRDGRRSCCCPRRSACSARRATTRSRSRPSRA